MARERRRLLIAPERLARQAPRLELTAEESRYLTRVLRYGAGDGFAVTDGAGGLWEAVLEERGWARLEQPLATPLLRMAAPAPQLVLAAAVVKRDYDLVVRMAVELGVDRLVPWLSDHGAVLGGLRPERWRTIAREAAEQCERLWLPEILEPRAAREDLGAPAAGGVAAGSATGMVGPPLRLLATTRRGQLPAMEAVLERVFPPAAPAGETLHPGRAEQAPAALWLACGPEGGWSSEEEQGAEAAGWLPVSLGPQILRSSTAAVAGLARLAAWRTGRWGG
ncbi:RsmE family RNA methyltransferase [Vulcanococcus limneticus]|uniref:RsmE family RNA methyltransferase n=1 Tax=Vulcanococcus limneticus TaxID=2170428 RepID=UPI00398BCBE3